MFRGIAMILASAGVLMALGWQTVGGQESGRSERELAPDARLYDADPAHLWNRLHGALLVRRAADGRMFGMAEVDPLLWPESTYLITGEAHRRAVALLDEFLESRGEKLIAHPVKRAVFQADLRAIFDWASLKPEVAGRALQTRLSEVIRRLALGAEEIARLPSNYEAAVEAKRYAPAFDPKHPNEPFLPPDLLQEGGDWVKLGTETEIIAPVHTRNTAGRSLFLVMLRLPGGRAATLEYLRQLKAFPGLWVVERREGSSTERLVVNPGAPQFPAGTQAALVRQLIVTDAQGKHHITPLVQKVQLRIYRKIEGVARSAFENRFQEAQTLLEFELSREGLFARKGGSLVAAGAEEEKFHILNAHAWDMVERERGPERVKVMQHCLSCHDEAGVFSLNSFSRRFVPRDMRQPPSLEAVDRAHEVKMLGGMRNAER